VAGDSPASLFRPGKEAPQKVVAQSGAQAEPPARCPGEAVASIVQATPVAAGSPQGWRMSSVVALPPEEAGAGCSALVHSPGASS
jgi:hypothetical protein